MSRMMRWTVDSNNTCLLMSVNNDRMDGWQPWHSRAQQQHQAHLLKSNWTVIWYSRYTSATTLYYYYYCTILHILLQSPARARVLEAHFFKKHARHCTVVSYSRHARALTSENLIPGQMQKEEEEGQEQGQEEEVSSVEREEAAMVGLACRR